MKETLKKKMWVMEEDRKDRTVFVCVLQIEGRSEG